MGSEYLAKLRPHVAQWLDEEGLSKRYLKEKLLEGLDATEVKVFNAGGATIKDKDGVETYVPGAIVYSDPLIAWGPRQGFLGLAMKAKGMLVEKVQHSGATEVTFRVIHEGKDA